MRGGPYEFDERLIDKYINSADPVKTSHDAANFPHNSTAYTAPRDNGGRIYELVELLEKMGFRLEKWDGKSPRPILDALSRVIAILAGQPDDPSWPAAHRDALQAIVSSRSKLHIPKKKKNHRRGKFVAMNWGISHGGGQKKPGNLCHSTKNSAVLSSLMRDPNISRIAGFASDVFGTWAPKMHNHYDRHLNALLSRDESLCRNWPNSVWAAFAVNFGPKTICRPHRDYANLPFGWCGITALGDFDPAKGGHLVLWELKIVIEFPPGSTILIPSAAITHSNVPVGKNETRCSFTQYSAGGLFRWVEQGFQPTEDYLASLTPQGMEDHLKRQTERCSFGAAFYSTIDSIPVDQGNRGHAVP